ncbi:hypothetical protein UWK_02622 [Desulfocapsa sulfexigens DSM 10523]|uniref:Uncharacterized protein n=1 Tax=Desulfocapsa sulfexigens (strain DSM 10523 / SB164P1) TaxID=1167006 RepID=M1P6R9_DESSD|nr:hypothetical protein [Desulfocapsa sulfexigens]AGF79158.1 hypothetical protein UWK_02622 [Desulfocapsa sulfexigens DSM 10523]
MEPLTLFAATVGLIGSIHLVSTTFERFGKGRYDKGNQQGKRNDWYCFFQPSDLLGEDWNKTENRNDRPSLGNSERLDQARRQQANRPRMQV